MAEMERMVEKFTSCQKMYRYSNSLLKKQIELFLEISWKGILKCIIYLILQQKFQSVPRFLVFTRKSIQNVYIFMYKGTREG